MLDFSIRHPDWVRMQKRWLQAWSFWRGGVHVSDPEYIVYNSRSGRYSTDASSSTGTPSELARPVSDFEYITTSAKSFLWRHNRELDEEFAERSRRAFHFPLFRNVINIYVAGILKTPPIRGSIVGSIDQYWTDIHKNFDARGTDVSVFIRRSLALALVFGRVHAVVDSPSNGGSPYVYTVSPLSVVDWVLDDFGNFEWVTIVEPYQENRLPGEAHGEYKEQYRVWTKTGWELFRKKERERKQINEWEIVASGTHNLGYVPISTLWCTEEEKERVMACESPLADILDIDRDIYNKFSELDDIERFAAFPILAIPEMEGGAIGAVEIGPARALAYNGNAGTPIFLSPDTAIANGKFTRIEGKLQLARQLAGTSRGKAEYSKEERSAMAISVESEDKRNQMSWWSSATEEYDASIHKTIAAMVGADYKEVLASYTKDFDFRAVSGQINDVVMLNSTSILPSDAMSELIKPIIGRLLRENGVDDKTILKTLRSIDKNAKDKKMMAEKAKDSFVNTGNPFINKSMDELDEEKQKEEDNEGS